MKKLAIAFAAVVLYAGAAFAGPACEGQSDAATGYAGACGPCVSQPSGGTSGCIALEGDPGHICVGGDAATAQGCVGAAGEPGGLYACVTGDGPAIPCDEAGCRAAAEAACAAAE